MDVLPNAAASGARSAPMERTDLIGMTDHVASLLPEVPRLAVLDAVDAEGSRFRVTLEPYLAPLVVTAAVWRLRSAAPAD